MAVGRLVGVSVAVGVAASSAVGVALGASVAVGVGSRTVILPCSVAAPG